MGLKCVLFTDLDGTLIDTNISLPGSAKYMETFTILTEIMDKVPLGFDSFYDEFNKRTSGSTVIQGSMTLCSMIERHYGLVLDRKKFIEYRDAKRGETYSRLAKFIGNGTENNGIWLQSMPPDMKDYACIVTSAPGDLVQRLNENPALTLDGEKFLDFFRGGIVTAEDVENHKPNPDCFNLAMERAGVERNGIGYSGIAAEDSIHGINAARRADHRGGKLFVIGVESTHSREELLKAGADYVAKGLYAVNLAEVLSLSGFN